jgi:hypothetical protein
MQDSDKNQVNQVPEEVSARFKTVSDILSDTVFIENLESEILKIRKRRLDRPEPRAGFRYRRDWYDQLDGEGNFNRAYILANIESIWLKKSSIPSNQRYAIEAICVTAYKNTLLHYTNLLNRSKTINRGIIKTNKEKKW